MPGCQFWLMKLRTLSSGWDSELETPDNECQGGYRPWRTRHALRWSSVLDVRNQQSQQVW